MAKNEAKIKFTADTKEFEQQMHTAENSLGEVRAELRLNDQQMKNTGASTEALQKRQELLTGQLQATQSKTEALAQKLRLAKELFGENSDEVSRLKRDLTDAQTSEERIRGAIAECNKALDKQSQEAKAAATATGKLTDKIDSQQTELTQLKADYVEARLQFGKTSDEAKDLAKKIGDLSSELKESKDAFSDAAKEADKLDKSLEDAGDGAKRGGDGFTVMKGVIADLASSAIQAAIGKLKEFTQYLMGLPEATREVRQDLATLDTSFEQAGFSTETATETWKELYKVFGEEDRAVEAANQISKMAKDQEDLSAWVEITKGVWGSYQDSLPVEGLAEASNETAKVGKVTGVFADALNWSSEAATMFSKYMSEDVTTAEDAFNEALKECTTEQERQALITETLTALYGDAATKYDEASGTQLAAKEATAENILVQNQLADTMEPLTTAWQGYKTELMTAVLPVVEKLSAWGVSALEWMKEHPTAVKAIAITLGVVAGVLGALAIAVGIYTAAQWAMNSAVLANPMTWVIVGVVAAIAALVAIGVVLAKNWDKVKAAFVGAWNKIKEVWGKAAAWFKGVANGIKNAFSNIGNWFKEKFTQAKQGALNAWSNVKQGFSKIWNNIKNAFSGVGNWFKTTFNNAKNGAVNAWSNVKAKFVSVKNGIVNAFSNIKDKLTAPFIKARDAIKGVADKIKAFFKGEISMPKIKMPHFSVTPSGWKFKDIFEGEIPKISIKWYASAYDTPTILNGATIFGHQNGTLLGGGEKVGGGGEMIGGVDTVSRMIQSAVDRSMRAFEIQDLATAIEDLAQRPIELNINGRQFALATASDNDSVGGLRATFRNRGLALD